ncbi:hypothetical protein LCGC14_0471580 [marine sediment metagenome]|uniref:Uncharacterized protein n=1 Tax=marine sediment metagenome TaxID=412755 RepID=A0A0F9UYZ0_9ZZZZ|nr:MAG: hypothetical protein Lokiarch_25430 [Candidatus Lokiarchaeum sp. GC14_75]HEC37601.1 hypothetical protein [bacterium]
MMSEDFKKVISVLKYWDMYLEPPNRDYGSRFKIQKLTYLCKSMGIPLKYQFTLYISGPYSTGLSQDYFNAPQLVETLETDYVLIEDDIEILDKINEYVLIHPITHSYESEFLEAVSTVDYLKKRSPDKLDDEIFAKTKEIKQHLKDSIVVIAINTVKKLLFKPEFLTEEVRREIDIWDKAED